MACLPLHAKQEKNRPVLATLHFKAERIMLSGVTIGERFHLSAETVEQVLDELPARLAEVGRD